MLKWLLTSFRRVDPPSAPEPAPLRKRVERLEIEIEELVSKLEAVWARQRKVEGTVHGMRGADRRHPQRVNGEETLQEFRDRMAREGRLSAARMENQHAGEQ